MARSRKRKRKFTAEEQALLDHFFRPMNYHPYTVTELIEELKACDQEARVVVGGGCVTRVAPVSGFVHLISEI